MAEYKISKKKTALNEGINKLTDIASDRGGETWNGISRVKNPDWPGWAIIDAWKAGAMHPPLEDNEELHRLEDLFYYENIWIKIKGDSIESQEIADSLFDSAVNLGVGTAIKLLQNTLFELPDDKEKRGAEIRFLGINYGVMDSRTVAKINNKI